MKLKPFHFTLESVRKLRQEAVDRAKDQMAQEMLQLNREQQNIDRIEGRIEQAREGFREAVSIGSNSGLVVQLRQFMASLELERTKGQSTLDGYRARVDACQKALVAAKRKMESMDKIRQKRHKEHLAKCSHEVQKEMDELMLRPGGNGIGLKFT